MTKLDLRKDLKHLYTASANKVTLVDVTKMNFLMADGEGDPDAPGFAHSVEALYALAYTLKFSIKKSQQIDYPVMALEGLWWMKGNRPFDITKREDWRWTLMILQPNPVTTKLVEQARAEVREKKNPTALGAVRFDSFAEGKAVQTLHIGPYSEEGPTLARMSAFIANNGYEPSGKHHEIYLSDPRRTPSLKLKTILRQPVTRR
jgi:hypothetical protein